MRTAGVLLLTAASALLGGCITTQTMPDGSTKVRITNDPSVIASSPLGRLLPGSTETSQGVVGADGVVSLIPTKHPLPDRGMLYLNGQFTYTCMTELMYAAKSGANRLRERPDEGCRQEYLIRQGELKRAGKPYDTSAPAFGSNTATEAAYWQSLVERNIAALRGANRFAIRFANIANVSKTGAISVRPGFGEAQTNDYVKMLPVPVEVPVVLDDAAFAYRLRSTGFSDGIACDATWEFLRTVDHNTGYNYGRFEVQFKTVQMGCREARPTTKR